MLPGNARCHPGQKSLWFVATGMILMAEEGGDHIPLFWFGVLHPSAGSSTAGVGIALSPAVTQL